MIYNNERRIDTTKTDKQILWKKYNFILTYKNNKSSLFSYTSFINKGKITINLKDLLAPYTTEYVLDYTCDDFINEIEKVIKEIEFKQIRLICLNKKSLINFRNYLES